MWIHPVRLDLSAEPTAIQQCFSLTINQRTVLSATINQRNEQGVVDAQCFTAFFRNHSASLLFLGTTVLHCFWWCYRTFWAKRDAYISTPTAVCWLHLVLSSSVLLMHAHVIFNLDTSELDCHCDCVHCFFLAARLNPKYGNSMNFQVHQTIEHSIGQNLKCWRRNVIDPYHQCAPCPESWAKWSIETKACSYTCPHERGEKV
jgi:hypothetical protein